MKNLSFLLACMAVSVFTMGCADKPADKPGAVDTQTKDDGHKGHDHAAHDHTPPHGGHLIELGHGHEYHAELVDDHESESVTIYILDSHMELLSIKQASISVVMTAAGESKTFALLASQPGGASEFKSSEDGLFDMLETEGVTGKVRVTINDKPFSGSFEHHDHDEHEGHDHDDHAGHDHS